MTSAVLDAHSVAMAPLRKPARQSSYPMAFTIHRHDHCSGGTAGVALSLKAASVTTTAGSTRSPRITTTTEIPMTRRSRWKAERGISAIPFAQAAARSIGIATVRQKLVLIPQRRGPQQREN